MSNDKLYQYRSINKYTIMNILNNKIRLNSPKTFNDPYDCKMVINDSDILDRMIMNGRNLSHADVISYKENNWEEYKQMLSMYNSGLLNIEELSENNNKLKDIHFAFLDNQVCISCFTEEKKSILMWSHYAECHKGICIEYSVEDLKSINGPFILNPVKYVSNEACNNDFNEEFKKMFLKNLFQKSSFWDYEKEWRLVYIGCDKGNGFNISVGKPTAIYMGAKIDYDCRELIVDICKKNNINVYQMELDKGQNKLNSSEYKENSKNDF